jgi:hypothetical protein
VVKKEKDDFLAAQGFAAANCLIRDSTKQGKKRCKNGDIRAENSYLSDKAFQY